MAPRPTLAIPAKAWLLLIAAVLLMSAGFGRAQSQAAPGVHVTGTGTVFGEPDTAILDVGVTTVGDEVETAMAQADEVMMAVRAAVSAIGVNDEDIVTSNLNVWRDDRRDDQGNTTSVQYRVRHSYQITVRDIDTVGDVLSAAIESGSNEVGGIRFTLSDARALAAEARVLALADARQRAEGLAAAAGVRLGAPISISETSAVPVSSFRQASAMAADGAALATGQLAISVTVQISYALVAQ